MNLDKRDLDITVDGKVAVIDSLTYDEMRDGWLCVIYLRQGNIGNKALLRVDYHSLGRLGYDAYTLDVEDELPPVVRIIKVDPGTVTPIYGAMLRTGLDMMIYLTVDNADALTQSRFSLEINDICLLYTSPSPRD